jgi:hypothetical protein
MLNRRHSRAEQDNDRQDAQRRRSATAFRASREAREQKEEHHVAIEKIAREVCRREYHDQVKHQGKAEQDGKDDCLATHPPDRTPMQQCKRHERGAIDQRSGQLAVEVNPLTKENDEAAIKPGQCGACMAGSLEWYSRPRLHGQDSAQCDQSAECQR